MRLLIPLLLKEQKKNPSSIILWLFQKKKKKSTPSQQRKRVCNKNPEEVSKELFDYGSCITKKRKATENLGNLSVIYRSLMSFYFYFYSFMMCQIQLHHITHQLYIWALNGGPLTEMNGMGNLIAKQSQGAKMKTPPKLGGQKLTLV